MKDILKLGGILLFVTAIASALLAMVNLETKPRIEEQARLETERALTVALPQAAKDAIVVQPDGSYIGYKTNAKQEIVGYVVKAVGKGYSSDIQTMVGIDTTGTLVGMKIISQTETPGLGTKVVEIRYGDDTPWFQRQFIGKTCDQFSLKKSNPNGTLDAITGATISSMAVTSSVQKSVSELVKKLDLN